MRLLRLLRLLTGLVLLAGAGALALVVAASGSRAGVDLAWPAAGLGWRTTALVLFLLGASTFLVAEVAVRLVLRALPLHPERRTRGRRAAR